jgi:hypothetical protein
METMRHNWAFLVIVACALGGMLAGGRATAQAPTPATVSPASGSAADTSLLLAVLRSLPRRDYHEMRFDPRVIRDDPNAVMIHPSKDFVEAEGPIVGTRALVVPLLRATRYVGDDYFACAQGPGGLGRADSAGLAMRAEVGNRRPYCVVAGVPRPSGPYFPAGRIDQRADVPAGAYTTRVVTMDPGHDIAYDIVATPAGSGGWQVVKTVVLWQSWS